MFERVRRIQAFERKHFPCLKSPIDGLLISEIGYYQERGNPLTMKRLLLLRLGAPATIRRRVQRLIKSGVLHKRRVSHDRRIYQLEIDVVMRARYAKYLRLISRV